MVHLSRILFKIRNKAKGGFIDNLRVYTKAGRGGLGKAKYGGTGGRGGSIYVVCQENTSLKELVNANPKKRFMAGHGGDSGFRALLGEPGTDLEIPVPPGVSVRTDLGRIIGEVNEAGEKLLVTKGGAGGSQATGYVGQKGEAQSVRLDLKLIADIGLVGFPNAGKSTLLSAVSRAAPKIAAYPFTTLKPQVGIMQYDDLRQISMADLPGLIEGAHVNVGMGHSFLKHVERTKLLLFMVDVHGFRLGMNHPQRTAFETIILLNKELELYKPELLDKPAVLALNKIDIDGSEEKVEIIKEQLQNVAENTKRMEPNLHPKRLVQFDDIFYISAKKRMSTPELKSRLRELLDHYADLELEEQGYTEKAIAEIRSELTEKFDTRLV